MVKKEFLRNPFTTLPRGIFVATTLSTAFFALMAIIYFLNENSYQNLISIYRFYLSKPGLALGLVVPIFIGAVTTIFINIYTKSKVNLQNRKWLKFLILVGLIFLYVPVTFVGAILILYFGK
jgi:hypothetical protein